MLQGILACVTCLPIRNNHSEEDRDGAHDFEVYYLWPNDPCQAIKIFYPILVKILFPWQSNLLLKYRIDACFCSYDGLPLKAVEYGL